MLTALAGLLLFTTFLSDSFQPGNPPEGTPETFTPSVQPVLFLPAISSPVTIDGNLDEPAWKLAAEATNFTENWPKNLVKPPVHTEARLMYDEKNLYIAFIAEGDPDQLRATLRDRDEIFSDDYMGILIDTYGNSSWYYEFFVNPLGVQGDLVATTNNEDAGADFIYYSEGLITGKGYQVELAIPFSSLRFPDAEEQVWRATIWRDHKADSRNRYSWAAIDRDNPCFPCQFGTLRGIKNINRPSAVEVLPYFIGNQAGARNETGAFENDGVKGSAGFSVKYMATPELTAEVSVNPDFSQIESDAEQIDVNTNFALNFPERRPFFQEGSDLFSSPGSVIYTRSINDPDFTAKLTGRSGKLNFVYLTAKDAQTPYMIPTEERTLFAAGTTSFSHILRGKYAFDDGKYFGALVTTRLNEADGYNLVTGLDGSYRFWEYYTLQAQGLFSKTQEPNDTLMTPVNDYPSVLFDGKHDVLFNGEKFEGIGFIGNFSRYTKTYNFETQYLYAGSGFRADNGFIDRNDYHQWYFWNRYNFYPENDLINQIGPGFITGQVYNLDGVLKDEWLSFFINFDFTAQTNFRAEYMLNNERWADTWFGQKNRWQFNLNSSFSQYFSGSIYSEFGRFIRRSRSNPSVGDGANYGVYLSIKPTDQIVIEPGLDYAELFQDGGNAYYAGYVFLLRTKYQFSRELSARVLLQYNEFDDVVSVEPLVSYKLNPFSVFYIGASSNHGYNPAKEVYQQDSRQFFLKFQYLFTT